jgi:hypothetical protein
MSQNLPVPVSDKFEWWQSPEVKVLSHLPPCFLVPHNPRLVILLWIFFSLFHYKPFESLKLVESEAPFQAPSHNSGWMWLLYNIVKLHLPLIVSMIKWPRIGNKYIVILRNDEFSLNVAVGLYGVKHFFLLVKGEGAWGLIMLWLLVSM